MKYVKESEIVGIRTPPPHERIIKLLITPDNVGAKRLTIAQAIIPPGSSSNPHSHEGQEEIFYILSGKGQILLGKEKMDIEPGTCIYIQPKTLHQLINTSSETLIVLGIASPPFREKQFHKVHKIEE